jgi:hypothetical protein
MKRSNAG